MILNHKEAIQYVVDNHDAIAISRTDLLNIHALLADGLLANPAMAGRLRRMPVGITHSSYRPLGDQFEIEEEFTILIEKAAAIIDPFEQSFFLLAHIPFLQAFDDINKRTSARPCPIVSGVLPSGAWCRSRGWWTSCLRTRRLRTTLLAPACTCSSAPIYRSPRGAPTVPGPVPGPLPVVISPSDLVPAGRAHGAWRGILRANPCRFADFMLTSASAARRPILHNSLI